MKIVQIAAFLAVVLVIVGFVAYSYYEIENSNGQVDVSINSSNTSSNYSAKSLNITITAIDLRSSNYSLWTNYSTGSVHIDLLDYITPHKYSFGNISLIEGDYTMIRLNITSATAVVNETPVHINLNRKYAEVAGNFDIPARTTTYFNLEFLLDGNFNMTSDTFNPDIQVLNL
ncbi:DUF4382 domain-containing protein [Oxyplasma meridianum]|uniref:DUF4382 domain-containing protein n=1 Tax=Oxyplasma meridianum TaxID=3073602 RepID=A0AAX4NIB7_9ARCH